MNDRGREDDDGRGRCVFGAITGGIEKDMAYLLEALRVDADATLNADLSAKSGTG